MDAISNLYELEDVEVTRLNTHPIGDDYSLMDMIPNPPAWIDQSITCDQVAAILQGGCASGAYMPAVTYHQAAATMAEHGDAVLQYLEDRDFGPFTLERQTWAGFAVEVLSAAVEAWAQDVAYAIENGGG